MNVFTKVKTMFGKWFKRAKPTGVRRGRLMGEPFNDGYDEYRQGRAIQKRVRKAARRAS